MPFEKNSANNNKPEGRVLAKDETKALLDHDLRSAVSDVIGGLQLLDLSGIGSKNQTQIARIASAAALALRLLDAEQGYLPSLQETLSERPVPCVDINALLHEVEQRWQGRVAAKGLALAIKIDGNIDLMVDELDLQRLLSNLLENAVKFTDQGQIKVTARQTATCVCFCVSDQGPGFSPEAMERLFSFGGRPEDSPKPGSGLGLFIAKQIVDRMSGCITAENTEMGARIKVEFPIVGHEAQPLQRGHHKKPFQRLAGQRILLAEDNMTNQFVAGQMLHALGAKVTIADDGAEAWDLLQKQAFDICLLDVEMPHKSGLELIREIRASGAEFAGMPLVVLTAYVMREHLQRIQQAGADGIIAKPLTSIEAFGEVIQSCCQNAGYRFAPPPSEDGDVPVNKATYDALHDTVGPAVFGDLLGKLVIDLQQVESRLKDAFKAGDLALARAASHDLISLSGAIGATSLLQIARTLNTAAQNAECGNLVTFEDKTLELLAELIVFLKAAQCEVLGA